MVSKFEIPGFSCSSYFTSLPESVVARVSYSNATKHKGDIYRFDGNTFAVDLASMPLAEFAKLVGEMQKAEPKPEMPGVTDPAPLTVRGIDFRDAVGLVNHLQAELPAGVRIDTSDEAAREIFGMLRRASDWDLEAAKFEQRALRMKRKLSDAISTSEPPPGGTRTTRPRGRSVAYRYPHSSKASPLALRFGLPST